MTDDATDALAQCRAQLAQQQVKIDSMGRQLNELGRRVSVTEQDTARHGLTLDRVSTILEHTSQGLQAARADQSELGRLHVHHDRDRGRQAPVAHGQRAPV